MIQLLFHAVIHHVMVGIETLTVLVKGHFIVIFVRELVRFVSILKTNICHIVAHALIHL